MFSTPASAQDSERLAARYKQMLEANPGQAVALDRLWKIYQEQSATAQLLDEYKAAEGANSFSAAMIHGHLLVRAGKTDDAAASFRHAAGINPQSPLPHLALAGLLQEKADAKNAATEFEAAAGLMQPTDSALPDVLLKLGAVWLAAGDTEKASEAWERTVALDPKNLELRRRLAENYIASNLPGRALPHYETVVADGDVQQRALALQSIARIYQMQGDTELAAQSLEKAIALVAPGNWLRAEMQAQLIRLYQRAHRTAELEQRWKKEASENPRDPGVLLQLIEFYERLGDPDLELEWLEKLHALEPENAGCKLRLARLAAQLGQNERAAELFDGILKEQPGNADVLFARAEIDLQNNVPQAARERIESFLRQRNNDESLVAKAVEFFLSHRLLEAAEKHLKTAAEQDETSLLALANFYFTQRRPADAKQTLQRLVKSGDGAEKKAAAHSKIAGILKDQKDFQGAQEELASAEKLQPELPAYHLALCDFFTGSGRFDEAQSEAEKALEHSKDEASQSEADSKLFQVFQMRESAADAEQKARGGAFMDMGGIPIVSSKGNPARGAQPGALDKYVGDMVAAAEKNPTPTAMLHVARWQMWRQKTKEAMDFARRAIEMKPDSIGARELFVKIASPDQKPLAVEQLRELVKLDPAHETAYSRQIGRLMLESGQTDQAIQLFSEMENAKLGDLDMLTDLAGAQQQSDRWDEAGATWQRAFDLALGQRRKEIATALVRVLEHGNSHEKAAAVLLKITDEQTDDARRPGVFQDLLAYCTKHDLLGWLQAHYERKLRANADDYFAQVALSKILKSNGREADALNLLSDATFSAEDQAPALRQLAAEAEEMGDFESAVQYQRRAVTLSRLDDAADLEKLAALQEAMPDAAAAAKTWEKIAAKFSRDPEVLLQSADFFQRWNDPAKERGFLQKAAELEPLNLQTWMRLGQLADDVGDNREAISSYEKILKNSATADDGGQIKFPGVKPANLGKLQQSYFATLRLRYGQPNAEAMRSLQSFWTNSDERSATTADLRLRAIRRISELRKSSGDKAAQQAWLARWQAVQPPGGSEPLWAFYFSGANSLVMRQLDEIMGQSPDSRLVQQGFVWLALQMREYDALQRWVTDGGRSAEERDLLLISLGQLPADGQAGIDSQLVDGLFPPQFKSRQILWQAAVLLASKGCFNDAAKLGERVLATATAQQAAYGLELAHWYVYSGDIDAARRALRVAISGTGDTPDAPIYAALREYFLLLPETGREGFIADYASASEKNPLHSALSLALLYGLQDNDTKAREQLAKLLELRPVSTRQESESPILYRVWNFILTTGLQFQAWKLNSLAVDLWEMAVADKALIQLQGEAVADNVRDIRLQLLVAKLAATSPEECDGLIEGFARGMSPESLFTLGNVLENTGAFAQAGKIYLRVWKSQPRNQNVLQRLLNTCNNSQDRDTEIAVLREALTAAAAQKTPDAAHQQAALQLARVIEDSGQSGEAVRVIEEALQLYPIDLELLQFAGDLYRRENQNELAEKTYRKLLSTKPDNDSARWTLFQLLEDLDKNDEAIALVEEGSAKTNNQTEELVRLYFKTGQTGKAEQVANKALQSRAFDKVPGIASVFNENKRNGQAVKLLQTAITRCKDANALNRLESQLFELLPDDAPPALQEQCFARLRSRRQRGFKGTEQRIAEDSYYNLLERLSKKFHRGEQFAKDLEADWNNGAGPVSAGLEILRIHGNNYPMDLLQSVCEALLRHPDFNSQTMNNMRAPLEGAKRYDLLEKGYALLCGRDAMRHELFINRARALVLLGKKQEAWDVLETLGARHVFADEVAGMVAEEYALQKNDSEAEKWFKIATGQGPQRNPDAFFHYARLLLDRKDFAGAKRILLAVVSGTGTREMDVLARYFIESGHDDRVEGELGEFALPPSVANELRASLVGNYCASGQPLKAIALASAHPEIVAGRPEVRFKLLKAARTGGEFEKMCAIFERAATPLETADSELKQQLAELYLDWARKDTATALTHLTRASELAPKDFTIAEALANRLVEKSQTAKAVEILNRYLSASRDDAGKEKAKKMISTLQPPPASPAR